MRRLLLAVAFLVLAVTARGAEPPLSRIDRLEHWLKALVQHEPGTDDDAVASVGSWSADTMRTLWIDTTNLLLTMRNPGIARFDVRRSGQRTPQPVRYTTKELHRLKTLACAAAGIVTEPSCVAAKAATELDSALLRLARVAAEARLRGDDNYILRRGALLHTDVAMLNPAPLEPVTTISPLGPLTIRMTLSDGRETNMGETAVHWEFARMLLDRVRPPGVDRPAPGRDDMVRQWYRATAAWMQWRQSHDTQHLDHAQQIFPNDPDILFLSGSLHETYAGPRIQNAVRTAVLPIGVKFDLGSEREELRRAEGLLRRAVEVKPDFAEAHLHFGRVLARLGRPAEAVNELTRALASTDDDLLRYYGELFLGAAREAIGQLDGAGASYARAAELEPSAQSPLVALSALARRRGDRGGALREIRRVFELPSSDSNSDDPWWTYHVSQARNAEELFDALIQPFLSGSETHRP